MSNSDLAKWDEEIIAAQEEKERKNTIFQELVESTLAEKEKRVLVKLYDLIKFIVISVLNNFIIILLL